VLALFANKAAFLRTPKTSEKTKWREALRANWAESTLALFGFAAIAGALTKASQLSGPLLAGLLLFPTLGLAAAPVNSWAARRAALPTRLRERRATEYRRDRRTFAGVATGGALAVLGVAIAAVVLLFTGHQQVQTPNLVAPAQGSPTTPAAPASPSSSPSTSPSSSPSTSPSSTPSTSPSASVSPTTPAPSTTVPPSPASSATPPAASTPTGSATVPAASPAPTSTPAGP
jgi:hypothetical protein